MSKEQSTPATAAGPEGDISAVESHLGKVLVLIQRILPMLEQSSRATEVQAAFRNAANCLESARAAHAIGTTGGPLSRTPLHKVATAVEPEIAAIIAAAVAVLFDRPYRLVSVQPVITPVPHLNVWALEGRTQIFQSHRIR